jgi:hypothetical protein
MRKFKKASKKAINKKKYTRYNKRKKRDKVTFTGILVSRWPYNCELRCVGKDLDLLKKYKDVKGDTAKFVSKNDKIKYTKYAVVGNIVSIKCDKFFYKNHLTLEPMYVNFKDTTQIKEVRIRKHR